MTSADFRMPSLGADMESGILTQWLKKPGDSVRRGEALAIVETTKGLIDIESFDDGVVAELIVEPGTSVPIGTVLARLDVKEAQIVPVSAPPAPTLPGSSAVSPLEVPSLPHEQSVAKRAQLSPAARRRAHELGIPAERLHQASGGILHIEDVEKLAKSAAAPVDPQRAMRTTIGNAMARSKREIPHYYLGEAVDLGPARDWLQRSNAQVPVGERLLEAVLLVKAVALAVRRIEGFNGYFHDGSYDSAAAVNVGMAIALRGGGLVAPALLDADRKDLKSLMRDFSDLVTRVRSGRMRSVELSAATITLTSLGSDGADNLFPIINPPQVAIVGAGAILERPWVCDGKLAIRPVLTVTLAGDHRVTDGRAGSHLLRTIAELLATPERL